MYFLIDQLPKYHDKWYCHFLLVLHMARLDIVQELEPKITDDTINPVDLEINEESVERIAEILSNSAADTQSESKEDNDGHDGKEDKDGHDGKGDKDGDDAKDGRDDKDESALTGELSFKIITMLLSHSLILFPGLDSGYG